MADYSFPAPDAGDTDDRATHDPASDGTFSAQELSAAASELLDRRVTADTQRLMLRESACSRPLWEEAAGLGWFSLALPADAGGLGLAAHQLGPLVAALGKHLVPGPFLEQMLLPALVVSCGHGDWPHLSAAVAGQAGLAFADPAAFTDPAAFAGPAVQAGPAGQLTGTVPMVVVGPRTDHVLAVATLSGEPALVLLDAARPGVALTALRSTDPAQRVARLTVDGAVVGDHLVLARGAAAAGQLARLRDTWRLLLAFRLAGVCRWALTTTVNYIAHRQQFGRAVGSFQAVKHIAADMARRTINLESLCDAVAEDLAGDPPPAAAQLATMTAKAQASAAARAVCESAIQLHGGIGFTAETPVGDYYKHALALEHWYGGPGLAAVIGTEMLKSVTQRR